MVWMLEKCWGTKWTYASSIEDMVTNQGLDSYFDVLKNRQRETWIREEIVCVKRNEMTRLK